MHHRSGTGPFGFVKRMLVPVIVGAALAVLAPAPSWAQTPSAADLMRLADQVFLLVNQERANAGLAAYTRAAELDAAARRHSQNMAVTGSFSHTGTDGTSPFDRIQAAGYNFTNAGENIAAGQDTAVSVMTTWMNSTGHRANILHADYKEIGISVVFQEGSEFGFYWTQTFGARAGAPGGGGGGTPTGTIDDQLREKERQVFDGINGERSANGFPVLRRSDKLFAAAVWLARDLAYRNATSRTDTGSDGSTLEARVKQQGYSGTGVESVVLGPESPAQLIDALWADDLDFNNMFGDWVDIGVGVAWLDSTTRKYFWVVVYGAP